MLNDASNVPPEPVEPIVSVEPTDWIAYWAEPIRACAETIHRNPGESVSKALNRLVNHVLSERKKGATLSVAETDSWLNGRDVPHDPAHNEALLMALGLRYYAETNGHRTIRRIAVNGEKKNGRDPVFDLTNVDEKRRASIENLITLRAHMEKFYENALLDALTRSENDTPRPHVKSASREGCGIGGMEEEKNTQGPIPEAVIGRVHQSNTAYNALSEGARQRILNKTESPAEYLACFRACLGETLESWSNNTRLSSTVLSNYESGIALPSSGALHKLNPVFHRHPSEFRQYETLLIKVRANIIDNSYEKGNYLRAALNQQELPREYWREAIRQLLGGAANAAAAPSWAAVVRPIESQGEYIVAMRHAFGKPLNGSQKQIAKLIGLGSSERALATIEADRENTWQARKKLVKYFSDLQEERLGNPDSVPPILPFDRFPDTNNKPPLNWRFFDPERFDPTSEKYLPIERKRSEGHQKFANRVVKTTPDEGISLGS